MLPNPPPDANTLPPALRPAPLWVQLGGLLFIEMTNWRWSWRSLFITGTIAPLLSILGLSVFARDAGSDALAYVLTGNLVVSLMFGNMGKIQSHVVFMRFRGILDYFATLPVRRAVLILAMVLAFQLISLPALLVTMIVGSRLLGVTLHPGPLLLLVIPLAALPLSGIGALVGVSARTPEGANSVNLVLTLLLTGLGPVIIPPERLPEWMRVLGWFSPATYAASALRQVLLGPLSARLWLDLAVLAAVSLLTFWLVSRKLDWRVGEN